MRWTPWSLEKYQRAVTYLVKVIFMGTNFTLGIVLAVVVCIVSGCGGVVGVVDDPCQWESRIYTESRDFICRDSVAVKDFNYIGDSLPVIVADSAIDFDVEYQDAGFEPRPRRNNEAQGASGDSDLCRSHKVFGLEKLSTTRRSRFGIMFGRIDSAYIAGQYVVMCALYYNEDSEMSKFLRFPMMGGDIYIYVFSYDASGRLISYARSKTAG
jgi:hypothetical protein